MYLRWICAQILKCFVFEIQARSWRDRTEGEKAQKCHEFCVSLKKFEDQAKLAIPHQYEFWSKAAAIWENKDLKEVERFLQGGFQGIEGMDSSSKFEFI